MWKFSLSGCVTQLSRQDAVCCSCGDAVIDARVSPGWPLVRSAPDPLPASPLFTSPPPRLSLLSPAPLSALGYSWSALGTWLTDYWKWLLSVSSHADYYQHTNQVSELQLPLSCPVTRLSFKWKKDSCNKVVVLTCCTVSQCSWWT